MPDWRRNAARAGAAGLLVVSVLHFGLGVHRAGARGVVDFPIFLARAREFRETGVLYPEARDPAAWGPAAAVYKFPPTLAVLLLPFAVPGGEGRAIAGHRALQVLLYVAAVALLLHACAPRRRATFVVLGLGLALNFEPFFETLWRLQIETPLLALLALALAALGRGRDGPLGAALATGAMLKVYPAFLAVYLVVRARGRALGIFALTAALIGISSWIVIGSAENRAYWFNVFPTLLAEQPTAMTENVSPARYLQTLAGLDPLAAKRTSQILSLAVLAISAWAAGRWLGRRPPSARDGIAFALFLPAMLLALPNSWVNYQLLLLPSLLALLSYALATGRHTGWVGAALSAAYLPLLFYQPCAPPAVPWPCAATPPFLGVVELPRTLHDAFVSLRGLSTAIVWLALLRVVWEGPRHSGERG